MTLIIHVVVGIAELIPQCLQLQEQVRRMREVVCA